MSRRRGFMLSLIAVLGAALALVIALFGLPHLPFRPFQSPYRLNTSRLDAWQGFGGAWEVRNGAIHNNSDERGAKLISGSLDWSDYTLQADLEFDANHGDMGLVIRSNDEDEGVDAYNGYYVGLRSSDGTLLVGRADYGWIEARPIAMPGGVHANAWYHLAVTAVGCDLVATSQNLSTMQSVGLHFRERSCVRTGRVGLRSFSTGGTWRNLQVTRATSANYRALAAGIATVAYPEFPKGEADYNRGFHFSAADAPAPQETQATAWPVDEEIHIGDLQNLSRSQPSPVTFRGVVTLTSPYLYVQDVSGGVLVRGHSLPAVNVGDAVEIRGTATPTLYSAVVNDAVVRDLWSGTPLAPISVTPLQASSGSYDNRFIEVEARLLSVERDPSGFQVLNLGQGGQVFRAVYWSPPHKLINQLEAGSFLRLQGVCALDSTYTRESVPFALLLRSIDDIQVLEGPPWWTPFHVGMLFVGVLALALLAQIIYFRIKHWQVLTITQERERLAHDIHDTMAQSFAGVGYQIQGIRSRVVRSGNEDAQQIAEQLGVAYQLVRHCHEEASRTISMMASSRSNELENNLLSELRAVAEEIAGDQVHTVTELQGTAQPLKPRLANAFFHIGQEAISNALAHAKPTELRIALQFKGRYLTLTVSDNGIGFNSDPEHTGFGILGMQKRAREINADVMITSSPGSGTSVRLTAPIARTVPAGRFLTWARLTIRQFGFGRT